MKVYLQGDNKNIIVSVIVHDTPLRVKWAQLGPGYIDWKSIQRHKSEKTVNSASRLLKKNVVSGAERREESVPVAAAGGGLRGECALVFG